MGAIQEIKRIINKLDNYTGTKFTKEELSTLLGTIAVLDRIVDKAIERMEEAPDCDNCDERKGDPPDYSWRD